MSITRVGPYKCLQCEFETEDFGVLADHAGLEHGDDATSTIYEVFSQYEHFHDAFKMLYCEIIGEPCECPDRFSIHSGVGGLADRTGKAFDKLADLRSQLERVTRERDAARFLGQRDRQFGTEALTRISDLTRQLAEAQKFKEEAMHEVGEAIVYIRRKTGHPASEPDTIMKAVVDAATTIYEERQQIISLESQIAASQKEAQQLREERDASASAAEAACCIKFLESELVRARTL